MIRMALGAFLFFSSLSFAGEVEPVVVPLSGGGEINWTTMTVHAHASSVGYGFDAKQKHIEQEARTKLEQEMVRVGGQVPVASGQSFSDLADSRGMREVLPKRLSKWTISEARYFTSGKVELVGSLELVELVKPWMHLRARGRALSEGTQFTGLVIDARSQEFQPLYAPRILDHRGKVLIDNILWIDAANLTTPVAYSYSLQHDIVDERVGKSPLSVKAERFDQGDIVLDAKSSAAVRVESALSPSWFHSGAIVIWIQKQ